MTPVSTVLPGATLVALASANVLLMLEASRPTCTGKVRSQLIALHRLSGYLFVTNAILHGNANDPSKTLPIGMDATADALFIIVSDQGRGFHPDGVPDPLAPENLYKRSGRGIFLIRTFMDEVHYRRLNPGTEVVLIKRRRRHR